MLKQREFKQGHKFKLLKKIVKIFGPEEACTILARTCERVKRSDVPIFYGIKNLRAIEEEVRLIKYHICQLSQFTRLIGVGPIGLSLEMNNSCAWIAPPLLSPSEFLIIKSAFQGEVFQINDTRERIFTPIPVIVNPISVDIQRKYVFINRGLEAILALLKRAKFPLYLVFSYAKLWYPYDIMLYDELTCLAFEFCEFDKIITRIGFLDFHQIPYLKEGEETIICTPS